MNDLPAKVQGGGTVIEILNRSGQVLQRVPYEGGALRIGRAYDNDLIVGDPYVCPHHLVLEERDGETWLRDLESINGSYLAGGKERLHQVPVCDSLLVHFGHSQLRFRNRDSQVAPAWRDISRKGWLAWFDHALVLLVLALAALLALSLDTLLDSAELLSATEVAGDQLYPIMGVLCWTGLWALLNRVISHRSNFNAHLAIACGGIAALFTVSQLVALAGFAWALDAWVPWALLAARVGVLALVLYAHLRYATHGTGRRQVLVAATAAILLFGTPAFGDYLDRIEFSTVPYLSPLLKPPAYQLKQGVDVEQFFEDADALREQLETNNG